jgi:hypothetical protein
MGRFDSLSSAPRIRGRGVCEVKVAPALLKYGRILNATVERHAP